MNSPIGKFISTVSASKIIEYFGLGQGLYGVTYEAIISLLDVICIFFTSYISNLSYIKPIYLYFIFGCSLIYYVYVLVNRYLKEHKPIDTTKYYIYEVSTEHDARSYNKIAKYMSMCKFELPINTISYGDMIVYSGNTKFTDDNYKKKRTYEFQIEWYAKEITKKESDGKNLYDSKITHYNIKFKTTTKIDYLKYVNFIYKYTTAKGKT